MRNRIASILGIVALASTLAPAACQTPTEVTVAIAAELAYRPDMAVAIQIDRPDAAEGAPVRVVTREAWLAGGTIGTVVVAPSHDEDDVVMRVVLATAREPSSCGATNAQGCIVVRRRIRFTRGASTEARIVLRPGCLGVFCDVHSSCAIDGSCGSLDIDAPSGDGGTGPALPVDGGDPYVDAVLADRPRHYYRLDEAPGTTVARDAMGRADGTFTGVRLGVTGALRSSTDTGAFFDGTSNVTIPGVEDLPGAFSVEAWARADTSEEPRPTILERADPVGGALYGYRMSKPPGTTAAFELFRGEQTFTADVRANKFADYGHLVAVFRAGELEIWRDGVRATTIPVGDAPPSAVLGPLVLGGSRAGASAFRGAIDEVAIYDYPLDEAQIRRHYAVAEGDEK